VVAREDGGDKRLVAYVVVANAATDALERRASGVNETAEWRRHLHERLPEYMVPAAFVVVEGMPLTPNGKVDRKRLPAPEFDRQQLQRQYVGPGTLIEEVLAGIWQEVLGVEQVGVHDNFFELGGHSLLATRLISRVREAFSVELPLRKLFEYPTVAGFAACIASERQTERREALETQLLPVARNQPLPLSFAQQRLWFLDQLAPGSPFYNLPVAVRLTGVLQPRALAHSLAALAQAIEAAAGDEEFEEIRL
jgi:acyl carrier protein